MKSNSQYLGDGVYIRRNDYGQLVLTTDSHNESEAQNVIFLEPEILTQLLEYVKPHAN